ncbi:MAG TPA: hypothetical protein VMH33_09835 [Solirubrobacterales bacterium]|nr:hypothetical protein [Solirubrobacterales bacterium]
MDPIERRALKRQAWMRLAAQRRRAGVLRGRVLALSLICFALFWSVIFTQMATGNDPVLSTKRKAVAVRAAAIPRDELETTDPREVTPEPEVEEEPEPTVEREPEPLVTSQS